VTIDLSISITSIIKVQLLVSLFLTGFCLDKFSKLISFRLEYLT